MNREIVQASVLAALALAGSATMAQDAKALEVRALAATCSNCHGSEGRPPQGSALPPLAGMPAARFNERMQAFKAGAPGLTVMHQIAKGFDEVQVQQMAAYFAALKPL